MMRGSADSPKLAPSVMLDPPKRWRPWRRLEGCMQAEGEVVRLPTARIGPKDFATFFAEEHARLFKTLYFVTGEPGGRRGPDAGSVPEAVGALGPDRPDRRSHGVPVPGGAQRVPDAAARRTPGRDGARSRSASSRDPFDEVDIREDVVRMLLDLAPRQRAALVLLDLYGYGSEEAARIMGIRPSTVRALATQGRAVLRPRRPACLT